MKLYEQVDTHEDGVALEAMIDTHGLSTVLSAIVAICHAKAAHVESNWQDKALAKLWTRNAKAIDKVAIKVEDV